MFKTDISNFFHSITNEQVQGTIQRHFPRLDDKHGLLLSNVLTYDGRLPQGAPSSPHLANLHMWDFDDGISTTAQMLVAPLTADTPTT
jgi:hypothetical protein